MKPKMYRRSKESKGSDLAKFKATEAGGSVEGIIVGPESSVGSNGENCAHPQCDQGNDKKIPMMEGGGMVGDMM